MRVLKGKLFLGDYSMKIVLAYFEKFIEMSGGIERVCCNMANAMAARGHEVSIVYCYGRSGRPFYALDSAVKTYNLMAEHPDKWKNPSLGQCVSGFNKVVREGLRIFSKSQAREWNESCKGRMIQQEIKNRIDTIQPDIIVSFRYETSNYLLHFAHVKVPVITMFHMSPDFILPGAPKGEIRAIAESSRAQVLLKRDIPVVERFCPGAHVVWIPNAVPQYEEHADPGAEKKTYTIINAARLNKPQKRQHLLVEAFAGLATIRTGVWSFGAVAMIPVLPMPKSSGSRFGSIIWKIRCFLKVKVLISLISIRNLIYSVSPVLMRGSLLR